MISQSTLFNQFLADVSDIVDTLKNTCEKYNDLWEENMPHSDEITTEDIAPPKAPEPPALSGNK